MTAPTGFLRAAGRRLEFALVGPPPDEAPTLVLLHEGLGSLSQWRDFPAQLASRTGLGALAYSRAGYGKSDPVPLPRPVEFMHREAIDALPEVLDEAGVREAVLVGHSDGGSISLIHASSRSGARGRERVRGLVLMAPHVFVEELTIASIEKARVAYAQTDLRARLARHHGDNVDVAFRGWNDVWLDPDFRRWNIEAYLPGVGVPSLVLQGEDDPYGTPAQVEAIARQSGGPVEVRLLAACGHSPQRDQPAAVIEAISDFVARLFPSLRPQKQAVSP